MYEHEIQSTALKIARDYLKFADDCAKQGRTAGRLKGNEKHYVTNYWQDLCEEESIYSHHPFYPHYRVLRSNIGKSRVAKRLHSVAIEHFRAFGKEKYPHFWEQFCARQQNDQVAK